LLQVFRGLSPYQKHTKQQYDKHRRANSNTNQPSVWFGHLPMPFDFLASCEILFATMFHGDVPVPQPDKFHRLFVRIEICYRCKGCSTSNKNASACNGQLQQQHMIAQQSAMMFHIMQGLMPNGQRTSALINIMGQRRGPRR
jgi:hypothetical protein